MPLRIPLALILLTLGLVVNRWTVEVFLISDAHIESESTLLVIAMFQGGCLALAAVLLAMGRSVSKPALLATFVASALVGTAAFAVISLPSLRYSLVDRPAEMEFTNLTARRIALPDMPVQGREGGIIAVDVDSDGRRDLLLARPGRVAAFDVEGERLWSIDVDVRLSAKAENHGLPGFHAAGIQAGDIDGDGATEVLFLTEANALEVRSGADGAAITSIPLEAPDGTDRWEHLVLASFRHAGANDLLLQATNVEGYRMGRYLAAFDIEELLSTGSAARPIWTFDEFIATAHGGARVADLDLDGRHEVLGATILSPDGRVELELDVPKHLDAIVVDDVRPDLPGLEVVLLEEGNDNRVFLYGAEGLVWETHFHNREPQNAAVGNFDPDSPGLEIWCRSRFEEYQHPFLLSADGQPINDYEMHAGAPRGWASSGVEEISTIYWNDLERPFAAAKERHESGDVGIFDPVNGSFRVYLDETAALLYVADIVGDPREELIVVGDDEIRIYENPNPGATDDARRLWDRDFYHRMKTNWNYYNP